MAEYVILQAGVVLFGEEYNTSVHVLCNIRWICLLQTFKQNVCR